MHAPFFPCCLLVFLCSTAVPAQSLPGTAPLDTKEDLALKMVDGIDAYLMRALEGSAKQRDEHWKLDVTSPEKYRQSLLPYRQKLRKILGMIDEHVAFEDLEFVGGPNTPAKIAETKQMTVYAVRWPVFKGVDGEGLLVEPKSPVAAAVIAIPDADVTPEMLLGMTPGVPKENQFPLHLAALGCRVVIPTLIDRQSTWSGNARLNRWTNIPHREFVYRMAYEMGRHLLGYETQKILALVDWFARSEAKKPIGVMGVGQGGQLALLAGALDERIHSTMVCAYFGTRQRVWEEPIDRNIWGQLRIFGDAELAGMILPRQILIDPPGKEKINVVEGFWPVWPGPSPGKLGRSGAAPGKIVPRGHADIEAEWNRFRQRFAQPLHLKERADRVQNVGGYDAARLWSSLLDQQGKDLRIDEVVAPQDLRRNFDPATRQKRQFEQLVSFTQKAWRDSEMVRTARFAKCDATSPEAWAKSIEPIRAFFWEEVIGKLPPPDQPMKPRSRQVYETELWTGYEIVLDLYPDVYASGTLLLPKGMKEGEKRPVVVCQHGLEGRPHDVCNPKEKTRYYNSFGAQLADRGYIVFAPQNPYIGQDRFRVLQRKANPLQLSLFSFIVRQHERIIDWLETLPNVDAKRIAFYGLSYGGKTAMRVPAILPRYCLSICSGDFNEWIGKNVSVDLRMSYMFTFEYEMPEFDLGTTFNYAEMAYLIAPRPFMVERGHDDGVGTDEMVAYEYAKVRYLYANRLKIPRSTELEFFVGGHAINGKGTFEFLDRHLNWKK